MPLRKKFLVVPGALVALMVAVLFALPLVFKAPLVRRAHAEIDSMAAARVEWSHTGLSFFRDFPNLALSLEHLTVVADGASPDTLVSVGSVRLAVDVASALAAWLGRGPLVVRSIRVDDPTVHLRVRRDGTSTWSLLERPPPDTSVAPAEAATAGSTVKSAAPAASAVAAPSAHPMHVALRSFEVNGADILMENRQSGLDVAARGLSFALSGDLSQARVALLTRAHVDHLTLRLAGVPWLDDVALDFHADVDADLDGGHFTFKENELRLNGLTLAFSGQIARKPDGMDVDVRFATPRTGFGQVLSLVPAIYGRDFASLRTSGTFSVQGTVRGLYGKTREALPALALHATVENGMFRYPSLPLPARDIALDLSVDKPAGDVDRTVVRVDRFHAAIGTHPLDMKLVVRNPVSDPDLDASVSGTLNLADLARTVHAPPGDTLAGVVTAHASVKARLSDVDAGRYERVNAQGTVEARDLTVHSPALSQPLTIHDARLKLTPQRADLQSFDADIGSSDLKAHGRLDNVRGFVLGREPLRGSAVFSSKRFVLDEWQSSSDSAIQVIPVPPDLDLTLDADVGLVTLGTLQMRDAHGKVTVKDRRLRMDDFSVKTLGGRVAFTGTYDTSRPARPTFDMNLSMDSLDIAKAAAALATVRTLTPVASYAHGTFSTRLELTGALAPDMTPVYDTLKGSGTLATSPLALSGFPVLTKLAGALSMPGLASPAMEAIHAAVTIHDGRLEVHPFHVRVGGLSMSVEGSNGLDQSLDYTLRLNVPRAALSAATRNVMQGLATKAGMAGLDLSVADSVPVGVHVTGTVESPSVSLNLAQAVKSVAAQAREAAKAAVEKRAAEARARADSAAAAARERARAQADSIVAAAQRQANRVRADARKLAAQIRAQADRQADDVVAKATNPLAKMAAQKAADGIRKEADKKASDVVTSADRRADAIVATARKQADDLVSKAGGGTS